jgi:hypothetical protein
MKVAIMQPYFLPYIGYFQLIASVDLFVIYDNIKYTKKGWINRNRILQHGEPAVISLPLKNDSDALDVVERQLAPDFSSVKLLNRIAEAYRKAPYFEQAFPLVERIVRHDERNLFRFLHNSIVETCKYVSIDTEIAIASAYPVDSTLKGQDKVIALCGRSGADVYINAIGGVELYSAEAFRSAGVELRFIRSAPFEYRQFGESFVPALSIVDVLMFNPPDVIHRCLASNYELIPAVAGQSPPAGAP